jgi:hypothetical protein
MAAGDDPDGLVISERKHAFRMFHDKLGPTRRWLERQVGRPWDIVRSELLQRFDTRTTAGRHIVFCHMLADVEQDGRSRWRRFVIDGHGLLRNAPRFARYVSPWARPPLPRSERELEGWLAGRRVGTRGPALFWFIATATDRYRQHHRLSDADARLWQVLPDWFRNQHVWSD